MMYNILWIDDEHDELPNLKSRAKRKGLNLIPVRSKNEAIKELESNFSHFDAILLDARFFENENDRPDDEERKYVHHMKDFILSFSKKKFEYFVLTGDASTFGDNSFNESFENRVYDKGDSDGMNKLFDRLKEACESSPDFQIKNKYSKVFSVCTDEYLGLHELESVLQLVKLLESDKLGKLAFNLVRQRLENLSNRFIIWGILDANNVTDHSGNVNLRNCSRELNNRKDINSSFARFYWDIVEATHPGSHISTKPYDIKNDLHLYIDNNRTDYSERATIYKMFDLMIYSKKVKGYYLLKTT